MNNCPNAVGKIVAPTDRAPNGGSGGPLGIRPFVVFDQETADGV
jgi:hypothetical protein